MVNGISNWRAQFTGPAEVLRAWIENDAVTDLLINGTESAYVEEMGELHLIENPFSQRDELDAFVERLVVPTGKQLNAGRPYLDGYLLEGSRFHIIFPPIARSGPLVSIRRFRKDCPIVWRDFAPSDTATWLKEQVALKKNILIAGATGSGKTSLMSLLLESVPHTERIAVLEESRELKISHPHVFYLEGRAETAEGFGAVTLGQLVRNSLRMRPDRIVVGEVRGNEAFEMLQALSTGHQGACCTVHAKGARDALHRLECLAMTAHAPIPIEMARRWVSRSIDMVVFLGRESSYRKIREIMIIKGLEGEEYRLLPFGGPMIGQA